ncbi:MAG: serine/threonine protein kinase, partial [Cyanobacteria bacterium]|nr:serine/threonine protein kinase [Cyanobacteriota bacterium]
AVYECRDKVLKKPVAIKTLLHMDSKEAVQLQEEARATSKLSHAGIVTVFDIGVTSSGHPYLVMELIQGTTLLSELNEKSLLPSDIAISIFAEVADALAYTHSKNVFHRDLKPSNIILCSDGSERPPHPKLIDFGLSLAKGTNSFVTAQGLTLVGTPGYMCPDQMRGLPYGAASEIYSLACVLYECLTGQLPFSGDSPLEIMAKHANEKSAPLSRTLVNDETVDRLQAVLDRAMEKDPGHRFDSMKEFASALRSVADHDPDYNATAGSGNQLSPANRKSKRINRRFVIVLAGFLTFFAILAGVAAVNLMTGSSSSSRTAKTTKETASKPPAAGRFSRNRPSIALSDIGEIPTIEVVDKQATVTGAISPDISRRVLKNHPKFVSIHMCGILKDDLVPFTTSKVLKLKLNTCTLQPGVLTDILTIPTLRELLLQYSGPVFDEELTALEKCSNLRAISFCGSDITDDTIAMFRRVPELNILHLKFCRRLTGKALTYVKELRNLTVLEMRSTQMKDGLPELQSSTSISSMDMSLMELADKDLQYIPKNVTHLDLRQNNQISHEGLEGLTNRLEKLRWIDLGECQRISEADIDKLKERHPGLRVDFD